MNTTTRYWAPALLALWLTGTASAETVSLSLLDWFAPEQQAQLQAKVAKPAELAQLYQQQEYRLLWQDPALVQQLLQSITAATDDGLLPEEYHASRLRELIAANDGATRIEQDLLLTDAYLLLAEHLLMGRLEPTKLDRQWQRSPEDLDRSAYLVKALTEGQISQSLVALYPQNLGYEQLKQKQGLVRTWIEQGGWPSVDAATKLKPGMRHPAVAQLRARLQVSDPELAAVAPELQNIYDEGLKKAVKRFQRELGLLDDAVVGKSTFKALNISAEQRLEQIWINLERLRWLPRDLGGRYIMTNIANFQLKVVDQGQTALLKNVIVGNPKRQTPIMSGRMTYMVVNPSWEVPPKLAAEDKLPLLQKDPYFLTENGFKVFYGWGENATEIDPQSVNWHKYSRKYFPYRLRQGPGPLNALGQVKFMFPNKFDVYIHDTPSKNLFKAAQRAFSSGCVRLEKPLELAEWLLLQQPRWTKERVSQKLSDRAQQSLAITPMPVHLVYQTAWVDETGKLQWREDIYQADKRLYDAYRPRHLVELTP